MKRGTQILQGFSVHPKKNYRSYFHETSSDHYQSREFFLSISTFIMNRYISWKLEPFFQAHIISEPRTQNSQDLKSGVLLNVRK